MMKPNGPKRMNNDEDNYNISTSDTSYTITISNGSISVTENIYDIHEKEEPDGAYIVYPDTPPELELPVLSGDELVDIINVAKSQIGYQGYYDTKAQEKYSVYGDWTGQHGCQWCSEFVAWCAYKANIPRTTIVRGLDSKAYIDFFAKKNQYFILAENKGRAERSSVYTENQFIAFKDIKAGDIVVIEMDENWADGADHTALCIGRIQGSIIVVEGNIYNGVRKSRYNASHIHGICRPSYNRG